MMQARRMRGQWGSRPGRSIGKLDADRRLGSNGGRMTPTRRARRQETSVPMPIPLLAILLAVAACATPAGGPGGSRVILSGDGTQQPLDRIHRQAHDALA